MKSPISLDLKTRIEASVQFGLALEKIISREGLLVQAIEENPWLCSYYIRTASEGILPWLTEEKLRRFMGHYQKPARLPLEVAVFMAGNVPFVGFHDLLSVFLAGDIPLIKFSSRDTILMKAWIEEWKTLASIPPTAIGYWQTESNPDFYIATGSDNTSRYSEFIFRGKPGIIRRNRFSVALLSGNETTLDFEGLSKDIFLYNGMGCRNVSHILVPQHFDLAPLISVLDEWPATRLPAIWHKKLKWEAAIATTAGENPIISKNILIRETKDLKSNPPGTLQVIRYSNAAQVETLLNNVIKKIQCVVGREISFGESQFPPLDAFADGVDVIQALYDQAERT